jgi:NAD(P)-dependent dehydrogenase (short-subunit alcohol dehydrogenase family)
MITGGTRGIGAAIARQLADAGHDLILGYRRDAEAAERTVEAVRRTGSDCTAVAGDLTDPAAVDELFATAERAGGLTGVVNNAGLTEHMAPLAETSVEVIRYSVEANLIAPLLVARAAVRQLGHSYGGPGGVIVNISSAAATLGSPNEYVHYAAAKAGVDTLTLGLAKEVAADGIRVVGIAPGLVRTDIHASAGDAGRLERIAPTVPLARAGEPDEIAEAVRWLLSDAASYVTGTTLRVSGGR